MSSFFLKLVFNSLNDFKNHNMNISYVNDGPWNKEALADSKYINTNVYNLIVEKMKYEFNMKYIFDGVDIDLKIVSQRKDLVNIIFLVTNLNIFLFILNKLKKSEKKLKLTLIEGLSKKEKPRDGKDLTSENVNTGITYIYFMKDYGEVIVFRKEEMLKVLLHELIHFYDFDHKRVDVETEQKLNDIFGIKESTITVNESFTDAFACIMNIMIYCGLKIIDQGGNYNDYKKECKNIFKIEYDHILKQSINILIYNGYRLDNNKIIFTKLTKEHTHVISYYVLKAIVFSNIDNFLKYLYKNNSILLDANEYINFIIYSMPKYLKAIKPFIKINNLNNSLRMTVIDIIKLKKIKLYKEISNQYNIKKWLPKNQLKR